MCQYCHSLPHLSGCPCAPDPCVVHKCTHCGVEICEGDDYYEINGAPYCEDCLFEGAFEYALTQESYHHYAVVEKNPHTVAVCSCCEKKIMSDEEYHEIEIDGETRYFHTYCYYESAPDLFGEVIKNRTAETEEYVPEYEPEFD